MEDEDDVKALKASKHGIFAVQRKKRLLDFTKSLRRLAGVQQGTIRSSSIWRFMLYLEGARKTHKDTDNFLSR
jgi:hypothetical protein